MNCIEPLETRIAPASVLTFIDVDGDTVKITSTLGNLNAPGVATKVAGAITGEQLTLLDLRDPSFQGTSITTAVTRAATGDGLVHIGRIEATGRDLGSVSIKGDLAVIDAGDGIATTPAIKLLSVRSMGVFGLSTQGGAGDLVSTISGALGALKIAGDLKDAQFSVVSGVTGKIGSISIAGSIIGGATANSGVIYSDGGIGPVKIGRDVLGGAGSGSGLIATSGKLASVAITGSLVGGPGTDSGRIVSTGDMGSVKIGGDVRGGVGLRSGRIASDPGKIGSVTIGGSLIGGAGVSSGAIFTAADLGVVKIGRDVVGDTGNHSGEIHSGGRMGILSVGGSVIGGRGFYSDPNATGQIFSGFGIGAVSIKGSLIGGWDPDLRPGISTGGTYSGSIVSFGDIGSLKVGQDVVGGSGTDSGRIFVIGSLGSFTIGGSLLGGSGSGAGSLVVAGNVGLIRIGGDLHGSNISGSDSVRNSGYIESGGRIANILIGGSIIAGTDTSSGSILDSASIRSWNDIGSITIKGGLIGNEAGDLSPVVISARGQTVPGATTDIAIKSLRIGGGVTLSKILAGFDPEDTDKTGSNGNASIGAVAVGGDWYASSISAGVNAGNLGFGGGGDSLINNPAGAATDAIIARIASITIKGAVIGAPNIFFQTAFVAQQIGAFKFAGFTAGLTPATDAQILLAPYTGNVSILEV